MTRGQVAKRLGKSLATIRRIEGILLHSTKDSHGVHRFDAAQVEALAQNLSSGEATLWQTLRNARSNAPSDFEFSRGDADLEGLERLVKTLRDQLDDERRTHQHELEALRVQHERDRIAEHREFEAGLAELMETLNELPD